MSSQVGFLGFTGELGLEGMLVLIASKWAFNFQYCLMHGCDIIIW